MADDRLLLPRRSFLGWTAALVAARASTLLVRPAWVVAAEYPLGYARVAGSLLPPCSTFERDGRRFVAEFNDPAAIIRMNPYVSEDEACRQADAYFTSRYEQLGLHPVVARACAGAAR